MNKRTNIFTELINIDRARRKVGISESFLKPYNHKSIFKSERLWQNKKNLEKNLNSNTEPKVITDAVRQQLEQKKLTNKVEARTLKNKESRILDSFSFAELYRRKSIPINEAFWNENH